MYKLYIVTSFDAKQIDKYGIEYVRLEDKDEVKNLTTTLEDLSSGNMVVVMFANALQAENYINIFNIIDINYEFLSDLQELQVLSLNPAFDRYVTSHVVIDLSSFNSDHKVETTAVKEYDVSAISFDEFLDEVEVDTDIEGEFPQDDASETND